MKKHKRELRLAACLLALAMCAALLCGCLHTGKADSYTAAMPVIVVGSDNYPPFNYTGSDGQPTGVDVELAQEAFRRLGYRVQFVTINWEEKKTLVENGTIDCAWGSFSMNGREDEYTWAGPYLHSRQVVAVRTSSDIYTLADLADKTLVVQSTTKPEELFLNAEQNGLPRLRRLYSLQNRDLLYTTLLKGYADALAAHESAIRQFMKDYSVEYRILDEPLMTARLGVAFAKDRSDDLPQQLTEVFQEMLADGTVRQVVSRYLDDPEHYLDGLEDSTHA
mgnify:CR=1 FL=1